MRPALSLLDAPAVVRLPEVCTVSTVNNGVVLSAPVPVPALVPEPVRVSGVSSESLGRLQRAGRWLGVRGGCSGWQLTDGRQQRSWNA